MGFEPGVILMRAYPPLPLILRKVFPSLQLGSDFGCDDGEIGRSQRLCQGSACGCSGFRGPGLSRAMCLATGGRDRSGGSEWATGRRYPTSRPAPHCVSCSHGLLRVCISEEGGYLSSIIARNSLGFSVISMTVSSTSFRLVGCKAINGVERKLSPLADLVVGECGWRASRMTDSLRRF